jgi:hypothetical protein
LHCKTVGIDNVDRGIITLLPEQKTFLFEFVAQRLARSIIRSRTGASKSLPADAPMIEAAV